MGKSSKTFELYANNTHKKRKLFSLCKNFMLCIDVSCEGYIAQHKAYCEFLKPRSDMLQVLKPSELISHAVT